MTKYRIKNYKGNLTESLSKFQKKNPGKKIIEAVEKEDTLEITTEDASDRKPLSYDEFLKKIDNRDVWEDEYGEKRYNFIVDVLKNNLKKFCMENDFAAERYDDLLKKVAEHVVITLWNGEL